MSILAYVFWHEPRPGADAEAYEHSLRAFQVALAADRPAGLVDSFVFRHLSLPWASPDASVYEDWYILDGFTALGVLNEAAVSGSRRPVHDDAARRSAWGSGGIYGLKDGAPTSGVNFAYWISKPEGWTYDRLLDVIRSQALAAVWQRQMVLGPAPEFCLHSSELLELDLPTVLVSSPVLIWPKQEEDLD